MTTADIRARPVLTSRGTWTVEVQVELSDGTAAAATAPEGKSTGAHEAKTVSLTRAVQAVEGELRPALIGLNWEDQAKFDRELLTLDGTEDKSYLGANTLIALSVANAKAHARRKGIPLWRTLAEQGGFIPSLPKILANMVNGGVHAGSGLPFQEYLVIPQASHPEYAIHILARFYQELGAIVAARRGAQATAVGDEGGYTPQCENPLDPLEYFEEVREKLHLEEGLIHYGLDVAASSHTTKLPSNVFYGELVRNRRVRYLEDPYGEDDFSSHAALTQELGGRAWVVGDDLTVTNFSRIVEAQEACAITGVIIKPNQTGTLTETLKAVRKAQEYGLKVIVSHRSGDTTDVFLADLAVAVGADGCKIGAPARGERTAKYNRLLEIALEME